MARTVGICESQPVTAEGLGAVLGRCGELILSWVAQSLEETAERLVQAPPDVLMLDKAFGAQRVLDCLQWLLGERARTAVIVWGPSMTDEEAVRFLEAGAQGVLAKTAPLDEVRACLLSVAAGRKYIPATLLRQAAPGQRRRAAPLTGRERQILELIAQGLKNREIAHELGICPGTVKVHLRHIFEKTGVRSRYALALTGLTAQPRSNE